MAKQHDPNTPPTSGGGSNPEPKAPHSAGFKGEGSKVFTIKLGLAALAVIATVVGFANFGNTGRALLVLAWMGAAGYAVVRANK